MRNKCPYCFGDEVVQQPDGQLKCKYCGELFSLEESKKAVEPKSFDKSKYDWMKTSVTVVNPAIGSPASSNGVNAPKGAEEIYKMAIAGVAEIVAVVNNMRYSGSGFVVHEDGYIITNAHVVLDEDGDLLPNLCAYIDGAKYPLEPVAIGNRNALDCALVKISKKVDGLTALPTGNSDNVKHGQKVFAIGNSLGEGLCITSGIISDLHRKALGNDAFMSDVATNHGNSGGPLFDENGKVIAICVAGVDGAKGMNYFIPINSVIKALGNYIPNH